MTAETTYQPDEGQLAREHDQVILRNNLMEPAELAEPDADSMAPAAHLAEPDGEQTGFEDPTSHPAGVTALPDQWSATSIASGHPDSTSDADDGAAEQGTDYGSLSSPSLVSPAFTVPEPVTESHIASNAASARGPWNEIQAMFVDDPRASVERAAALVNDRVEALIRSFMERQRSAQSAWEADGAGTEELRVALRHYRTFWSSIADFPKEEGS
jgi:hypothetical protein